LAKNKTLLLSWIEKSARQAFIQAVLAWQGYTIVWIGPRESSKPELVNFLDVVDLFFSTSVSDPKDPDLIRMRSMGKWECSEFYRMPQWDGQRIEDYCYIIQRPLFSLNSPKKQRTHKNDGGLELVDLKFGFSDKS
jgi:hypothetical protein